MSYQVLARKWRPKSFATLVGQEHVVRALGHALDSGRLHHAWLFTGTRGVGKTTISRILAKALNCERGVSASPCDACAACVAIDQDRFADYVEMDAASNRGVDDMAALLEQAVYAPVQGRYKVYMIDEVHMLTGHAFNAMLKTLEEPPEHLKFILATTDPQKIPVTVLSRCLQFNLKQMAPAHIHQHLSHILAAETIAFEPAALHHLAQAAAGSMRDALSLLDQAIAHGGGKVEEAQVAAMLGMVGDEHLHGLLDALAAGDVAALIGIADAMEARSLSFDAALQGLARLLQRIALAQYAPAAIADEPAHERIVAHAGRFDAEFLQLAYQIAIHGREELSLAPDEYTGFTMALLRLHAFRPEQPAALGSSGVVAGGSGQTRTLPAPAAPQGAPVPAAAPLAGGQPTAAAPAPVAVSPPPAVQSPVVPPAVPPVVPPTPAVPPPSAVTPPPALAAVPTLKSDEGGSDVPPWEDLPPEAYGEFAASLSPPSPVPPVAVPVSAAPAVAPPAAAVEPPAERDASLQPAQSVQSVVAADAAKAAASAAAVPSADPAAAAQAVRLFAAGDWAGLIRCAGLSGMQRELAQHCAWQGLDGEVLHLQLAPAHRHLIDLDQSLSIRLQEQLASLLARPALRLRIEVAEAIGETPAQRAAEERRQRQLAAQAALEADPFVRELRARFDAALAVDSIRPCVEPA